MVADAVPKEGLAITVRRGENMNAVDVETT
jgi:hypothetical protein